MITPETILKAAKAAGLHCYICGSQNPHVRYVLGDEKDRTFSPLTDDGDNAMIRRGAEIDLQWLHQSEQVDATAYPVGSKYINVVVDYGNDKAQAEREAVILCAAAKWDAMNEGVK